MDDEDWAGNGADDAGGPVDWRKWIAKNTPTEKQEKLLDRIRCGCVLSATLLWVWHVQYARNSSQN
jgi:hypothetical protein